MHTTLLVELQNGVIEERLREAERQRTVTRGRTAAVCRHRRRGRLRAAIAVYACIAAAVLAFASTALADSPVNCTSGVGR
jgi:hypothetical protein